MITLIESSIFAKLWPDYRSEDERGGFAAWLAQSPETGDVIPGSGGIKKGSLDRSGQGKRGGVRVIYYAQVSGGLIWLLTIYENTVKRNIPTHILKALKQELVDGYEWRRAGGTGFRA